MGSDLDPTGALSHQPLYLHHDVPGCFGPLQSHIRGALDVGLTQNQII